MKVCHRLLAGSLLVVGMSGGYAAHAAERLEVHECNLKYKKNETAVPMKEFNDCLRQYSDRKADVEFIHLLASSRTAGTQKKNLDIAERRLKAIKTLLAADYPNARIEGFSLGSSAAVALGDSIRMTAVVAKQEKATAMEEGSTPVVTEDRSLHTTAGVGKESGDVQVEPAKSEELPRVALAPTVSAEEKRENFARVAARMGQDADRGTDESYPAIGLEAAYVRPNTGAPHFRTEIGGTAVTMSKGSEMMRRASAHVLLGAGYSISGVVIGARALGGGVWDEQEKWRDDFGGEGRLGFESGNVSVFAGIGRTDKTSRFGLDVGLML